MLSLKCRYTLCLAGSESPTGCTVALLMVIHEMSMYARRVTSFRCAARGELWRLNHKT